MKKIAFSLLLAVLLLTSASCSVSRQESFHPVIAPGSYAITVSNTEDIYYLNLKMFDHKKNSKRSSTDTVNRVYIGSPDEGRVIKADEIEIYPKDRIKLADFDAFEVDFILTLITNHICQIKDAHIELEYVNGESEQFYMGDIAFIYCDTASEGKHVKERSATPVCNEYMELQAMIIELEATEEARLTQFNFNLPKYGINADEVKVFHDNDSFNKIKKLQEEGKLDSLFPGIYKMDMVEDVSYNFNNNTYLHKGMNMIVIPFTFKKGERYSPIKILGGYFEYEVDGQLYRRNLLSIPYVLVSSYMEEKIMEWINYEGKRHN